MRPLSLRSSWSPWLLLAAFVITAAVYWPGLHGGFLFDDYPNIVDNHALQIHNASVPSLVGAALSSPSSEFKRPLASLSFAVNYLETGLNPYWMKLTNLLIHLLNGLLVFWLTRALLRTAACCDEGGYSSRADCTDSRSLGIAAVLVAAAWMLQPINLTGVLYVVQRMESMANAFVLLGLIGYVAGRRRMLASYPSSVPAEVAPEVPEAVDAAKPDRPKRRSRTGFILCVASIVLPAIFGITAKETAVMLPLYALLIEWALFRWRSTVAVTPPGDVPLGTVVRAHADRRLIALFALVLVLPMIIGLVWLLPHLLRPSAWATRDFTLGTRLLSEARIVVDYIVWTLLPNPAALSFYHDDFNVSTGLLSPWTTLACIVVLAALVAFGVWIRKRCPLVALGIALFLGCQLLTGTILPLELIYEHRNYFASFGLMLAIVPLLAAPPPRGWRLSTLARPDESPEHAEDAPLAEAVIVPAGPIAATVAVHAGEDDRRLPLALPRYVLLSGLLLFWAALTAITAYAWGNPLRLAEDLARRAPDSPRAQYELGRTYIIYSQYNPASPFTHMAYAPLERAATLPDSSILPQQALIFMNARMHLPLKAAWWDSMVAKLKARPPGVQDESSLAALTECARTGSCDLPKNRMTEAFLAALSHPNHSARLLATYGDYAWNVLDDHALGERMTKEAVKASPDEPAYQITLIRMLVVQGKIAAARAVLQQLSSLNIGGRLDGSLAGLRKLIDEDHAGGARES